MKSFPKFRLLVSTVRLAVVLGAVTTAWSAPVINSIEVIPTPLRIGTPFSINVAASPDVTQGTATVDFRPSAPTILRVVLTRQGNLWTGSGIVPLTMPAGAPASVKVILLDANRQRTEQTVQVSVIGTTGITASFSQGILTVTGDDSANEIAVSPGGASDIVVNGGAVNITGGTPTTANTLLIRILGEGGNDVLSILGGTLPSAEIHGGSGDDTINGGVAADELHGGPGADTIIGRGGNDLVFCGEDDDTFVWNPGDASDTVEGQDGQDRLLFNGSGAGENIDISADAGRLLLFRNVANILMDCDGVEVVDFNALGGADTIVVNDLAGTDVITVGLNLAAVGGAGDGQPDNVVLLGTNGDDLALVSGSTDGVAAFGLSSLVTILGSEGANDRLTINLLAGDDVLDASALPGGIINLTGDGGFNNDILLGSEGPDVLLGADGDDVLIGGPGLDVLDGGPGDNIVIQD